MTEVIEHDEARAKRNREATPLVAIRFTCRLCGEDAVIEQGDPRYSGSRGHTRGCLRRLIHAWPGASVFAPGHSMIALLGGIPRSTPRTQKQGRDVGRARRS